MQLSHSCGKLYYMFISWVNKEECASIYCKKIEDLVVAKLDIITLSQERFNSSLST